MRHETQQRVEEWRISLPNGTWRKITVDHYNETIASQKERYRIIASQLGISYEPKVQRRTVLRTTVTIKTVTDQPGEWSKA